MQRRAREEQEAADRASSPRARELHIELAGRYRDAAEGRVLLAVPDVVPRPRLADDFRILE